MRKSFAILAIMLAAILLAGGTSRAALMAQSPAEVIAPPASRLAQNTGTNPGNGPNPGNPAGPQDNGPDPNNQGGAASLGPDPNSLGGARSMPVLNTAPAQNFARPMAPASPAMPPPAPVGSTASPAK